MAARQGRSGPDAAVSDDRSAVARPGSSARGGRRAGSGPLGPSLRALQAPTFGRVRGRAPGGRGRFQQDPEENSFGPEAAVAEGPVPGAGWGERRTRECGAAAQVPRGAAGLSGAS